MEGRNFIGIEKNEDVALFKKENIDYIDVAKRRLLRAWESLDSEKRGYIVQENLIKDFEAKREEPCQQSSERTSAVGQ